MWPFNRKKREEERVRQAFGEFLSPEALKSILDNSEKPLEPPKRWRCAYILLQVTDREPEKVPELLTSACDILDARDGFITNLFSSFLLATFGLPLVDDDVERGRSQQAKAVARLLTEMGAQVRLIHGAEECLAGHVGSRQRIDYGILLPDSARKLGALLALDYGQAAAV